MGNILELETRANLLETNLGSPFDPMNTFNFSKTLKEDETEEFPQAKLDELKRLKISDWIVLKKFGGQLEHYDQLVETMKSIARRDMTTQITFGKNFLGSLPVFMFGSDSQISTVVATIKSGDFISLAVTEKTNGSDLFKTQMNTRSETDESVIVDGNKWLINNIANCQHTVLLTKIDKAEGARAFNLLLIEPKKKQSGQIIEGPKIPTYGVRGMNMGSMDFKHARFSGDLHLGKEGHGIDQILKTFQVSKGVCAGLGIGAIDTCLRLVTEFVLNRNLYSKTIDQLPIVQYRLANIYARLQVLEVISYFQNRAISFFPECLSVWSAFVKYYIPTECELLMNELSQILGARYFIRGSLYEGFFQKCLRDIALVPLFDGSTQVNLYIIANQLAQITTEQTMSKGTLEKLNDCFNLNSKPPELSFEKLNITNRSLDPLLGSGKELKELVPSEFSKCIDDFNADFVESVEDGKRQNIENFEPLKFKQAKQYCLLQAIHCVLWNQKSDIKIQEPVFKMAMASCLEKVLPFRSWDVDYHTVFKELVEKVTQDRNLGILNYSVAEFYKSKKDYDFV